MRILILASVLALAACNEPEINDDGDEAEAQTSSSGSDVAASGDKPPAKGEKPKTESEEEAKITEELKNSVAKDKADGPSKTVDCTVSSAPGDVEYKGQCEYFILGGDSFTMVRSDGLPFFEQIVEVIIEADTPTRAGMSVRMSDGERPGFGTAYREPGEQCWINDSLDVCWKDM
ncbi:hypothetical protein [Alterisphingorhabdus coralli]|uniref:Uncharacterized protein n=1 Tax=Alterisphingorhabdus coralli TaxID=3071408 RepID=A0AA97F6N9_9SPHN|nr:hypothetical protein [Parasphingorhabdus sp. SCSIO 66989]WOE75191.1 hypothetical protein RB602_00285 [Parasphingorhabdus sp. SCSIO 66989]